MEPTKRLRQLLQEPGPVLAPGVYDCISAKVVERAGFDAAFVSGAAVTASILGYPDVGLQTMPEILAQVRNMARLVEIPLIVDIDTGYGNALNLMRAIRDFESAGAAGVFFEDQGFPKRCGHFEGKKIISTEEMAVKVRAACEARRSPDFIIIARTDARALEGLDRAIERIADAPSRWPAFRHGTRRFLLRRFPFSVVYREAGETVQVIAVAHGRRKPGYWKGR